MGFSARLNPHAEHAASEEERSMKQDARKADHHADVIEQLVDPVPVEFEEHGTQRQLKGIALLVLMGAALAFSAYQLMIAAFSPLSSEVTRSLHVVFLLVLPVLVCL